MCKALEWQGSAHSIGDADISVTQLIDSPLIRQLRTKHENEIQADYSDTLWPLFGSIAHEVIAKHGGEAEHVEHTLVAEHDEWKIKGTVDYIYEGGVLWDYKMTSTYTVESGPREEWIRQLNVYRWLIASNPLLNLSDIQILKICALLRDWGPRHKDKFPCQVQVVDVPLWDLDFTRSYISERIKVHKEAQAMDVPSVCTDEERWAKPPIFAVMKTGRKTSLKNCLSREAAENWMAENAKGEYIEERPQIFTRCELYCEISKAGLCPYHRREA